MNAAMRRKIESIPEENKNGDCFQRALHRFMEDPARYKLVHGVVTGQGPIDGLEYCHAWVLDGDYVIDDTLAPNLRHMPKVLYYAIGNIHITVEYNRFEVYKMLDTFGTYGPWDKIFEDYP